MSVKPPYVVTPFGLTHKASFSILPPVKRGFLSISKDQLDGIWNNLRPWAPIQITHKAKLDCAEIKHVPSCETTPIECINMT
jgi:hypothetical protein